MEAILKQQFEKGKREGCIDATYRFNRAHYGSLFACSMSIVYKIVIANDGQKVAVHETEWPREVPATAGDLQKELRNVNGAWIGSLERSNAPGRTLGAPLKLQEGEYTLQLRVQEASASGQET